MQSLKRAGRGEPESVELVEADDSDEFDESDLYDTFEMYRVVCPDCARPIALLADEDVLPEHALCPSPWNPFVLTVCAGTGRRASEAGAADESPEAQEQHTALLLTLPQGLDWRTQPFSHVGGPGSRPFKSFPAARQASRAA
ncbi:hypothetical protein OG349_30215 [Streptomyces sp. NBC_01317]|uniref:hypothetical protein n=1 Tax=unclassified Streptomyces TaxID=2593676 RepID=UPI002E1425EE|nr:hypothetical protein OG349_30215 [Streptomyces sp. NBC_01317]